MSEPPKRRKKTAGASEVARRPHLDVPRAVEVVVEDMRVPRTHVLVRVTQDGPRLEQGVAVLMHQARRRVTESWMVGTGERPAGWHAG
jgi:hypothetical protein